MRLSTPSGILSPFTTSRDGMRKAQRTLILLAMLSGFMGSLPREATAQTGTYEAERDLYYTTGSPYYGDYFPDSGVANGLMADPRYHAEGFLTYGPYVVSTTNAKLYAGWTLRYRGGSRKKNAFALEVYDASAGRILWRRFYQGGETSYGYTYIYSDSFVIPKGHLLELRTYWHGTSTLWVDKIRVRKS